MNDQFLGTLESAILEGYELATPIEIRPILDGTNNESFSVVTGSGDYILKWHRNARHADQSAFTNQVLSQLHARKPSFRVPFPVLSRTGDFSFSCQIAGAFADLTLTERIDGTHPSVGDVPTTGICGATLGELDVHLSDLIPESLLNLPVAFPRLGEIHQRVPDPLAATDLPFARREITEILNRSESDWLKCTEYWQQQIIHGDFFSPNVLVRNGTVTGVLDFEFSGLGHRAMDLAVAIRAFCLRPRPHSTTWELIRALASGYSKHVHLCPEEIIGLPILLIKREASSFVHWLGRSREQLPDHSTLRERAELLVDLNTWLNSNANQLVETMFESVTTTATPPRQNV